MSEGDHIELCILGICISIIVERCIVPQIACNDTALRALTRTLILALGPCIWVESEKGGWSILVR